MYKTNKTPVLDVNTASGAVASFDTLFSLPLASHKIALTATQSGSGTPSPDNVRTINGYSAIGVSATGKNLFSYDLPIRKGHWLGNVFNGTNEKVSLASASSWCYIAVPVVGNSTITISNMLSQGGTSGAFLSSLDVNDTVGFFSSSTQNGTKTVPSGAKYMCLVFYNLNSNYSSYPNAQFEVSESATAFEPFGTYTTINLGGTYYGGEYDARTGVLTVTHGIVDLGTLNWNRYTTQSTNKTYFRTSSEISDCKKSTNVSITYGLTCSNYVEGAWTYVLDASGYDLNFALGWSGRSYIAIYDSSKSEMTAADFKTAMNGVQLMYPLATPQTIQLPPCPIDTLEGVNNIWSDVGDTSLSYNDLNIAKRGSFREVFKIPTY